MASATATNAASAQDAGLFASSGTDYAPTTATFGGFTITG